MLRQQRHKLDVERIAMHVTELVDGGAPTGARRKDLARTAKPLRHEATRRPRNARIARITENKPVTART